MARLGGRGGLVWGVFRLLGNYSPITRIKPVCFTCTDIVLSLIHI